MVKIKYGELEFDHLVIFERDRTVFAAARENGNGHLRLFLVNETTGNLYTRNGCADSWEQIGGMERDIILARITAILEHTYHESLPDVTVHTVTARLAFKADPELNELRLALERIERGEYGNCIFCKQDIPLAMLTAQPTAHFCDRCTAILRFRTRSTFVQKAS